MQEKYQNKTRDHRWIVVSGFLFVAAWIVGLLLASPPAITAPLANLIAYYEGNKGIATAQVDLANGLTGLILIVFTAALYSVLRRSEGESSLLSTLLLGSGLVVACLSCFEALFAQVLANDLISTKDTAVIQALLALHVQIDTFKLPILGLMIGATSLLAKRVGAFPHWLVWVGDVEFLLLVIAGGTPLFASDILTIFLYVSGIGLLLWVASVSVLHLRSK